MDKSKRILSLFLSILMIFSVISPTSFAKEAKPKAEGKNEIIGQRVGDKEVFEFKMPQRDLAKNQKLRMAVPTEKIMRSTAGKPTAMKEDTVVTVKSKGLNGDPFDWSALKGSKFSIKAIWETTDGKKHEKELEPAITKEGTTTYNVGWPTDGTMKGNASIETDFNQDVKVRVLATESSSIGGAGILNIDIELTELAESRAEVKYVDPYGRDIMDPSDLPSANDNMLNVTADELTDVEIALPKVSKEINMRDSLDIDEDELNEAANGLKFKVDGKTKNEMVTIGDKEYKLDISAPNAKEIGTIKMVYQKDILVPPIKDTKPGETEEPVDVPDGYVRVTFDANESGKDGIVGKFTEGIYTGQQKSYIDVKQGVKYNNAKLQEAIKALKVSGAKDNKVYTQDAKNPWNPAVPTDTTAVTQTTYNAKYSRSMAEKVTEAGGLKPVDIAVWVGDKITWKNGVALSDKVEESKKTELQALLDNAEVVDLSNRDSKKAKDTAYVGNLKVTFEDDSELTVNDQNLYVWENKTEINDNNKDNPKPADAKEVTFKAGTGVTTFKDIVKVVKENTTLTVKTDFPTVTPQAPDYKTPITWKDGQTAITEDTVTIADNKTFTANATSAKFDKDNVVSFEIIGQPKTSYVEGNKLNLDSLKVELTDKNGNTKEVPFTDFGQFGLSTKIDNNDVDNNTDATVADHNGKKIVVSHDQVTGTKETNALTVVPKLVVTPATDIEVTNGKVVPKDTTAITVTPNTGYTITETDPAVDGLKIDSNGKLVGTPNVTFGPDETEKTVNVPVTVTSGSGDTKQTVTVEVSVTVKKPISDKDVIPYVPTNPKNPTDENDQKIPTEDEDGNTIDRKNYVIVAFNVSPNGSGTLTLGNVKDQETISALVLKNKKWADVTLPTHTAKGEYVFWYWTDPAQENVVGDEIRTALFIKHGDKLPEDNKKPLPNDFATLTLEKGENIKENAKLFGKYAVKINQDFSLKAPESVDDTKYTEGQWYDGANKLKDQTKIQIAKDKTITAKASLLDEIIGPVDPGKTQNPDDKKYFSVTFKSEDETKGTVAAENTFYVLKTAKKTLEDLKDKAPKTTPKANYVFKEWKPALDDKTAIDKSMEVVAYFSYNGKDIVPQPGDQKPDVPDTFVLVEFNKGAHGEFKTGAVTKYWVNPDANKTLKDITKPEVEPADGYKFTAWDKTDDTQIKAAMTVTANYDMTDANKIKTAGGLKAVDIAVWVGDKITWKNGVALSDKVEDSKKTELQALLDKAEVTDLGNRNSDTARDTAYVGSLKVTFEDDSELTVENQNLYVWDKKTEQNNDNKDNPKPTDAKTVTFAKGEGISTLTPENKVLIVKSGESLTVKTDFPTATVDTASGYQDKVIWKDGETTIGESVVVGEDKDFTATAGKDDASKYTPQVDVINKDYTVPTTEQEIKDAIHTGYPDGEKQPTIKIDDPTKIPDGFTEGTHDVEVTITYPDGSEDKVTVKVVVKASTYKLEAELFDPRAESKFIYISGPAGATAHITIGNRNGGNEVTYVLTKDSQREKVLLANIFTDDADKGVLADGESVTVYITDDQGNRSYEVSQEAR